MLALQTADHTLTRPFGPCPHPCGIQRISSTANAQGLRGLAADIGGSPVCPVPSRTPQLFLTSRFFRCFSVALSTRTLLPTVIRRFAALSATFPPRTPQPFLTSRLLRHPFSTLSTRTVVPTAIRTFVLHPVALLASNPSSKNSAAAPHLRFFRRLFTVFHGTVKSAAVFPTPFHCLPWYSQVSGAPPLSSTLGERSRLERLHSTTSRNLTPVIGWVRCAVHATSPRPSLCDQKLGSARFLSRFAPVSAGFGASGPRQLSQTFYGLTQTIACAEGLPL